MNEDHMNRNAVMASTTYMRNKDQRQKTLDKYYNGEYELLDDYTGKVHSVYKHRPTGNIYFGIRGTDALNEQGGRVRDLASDIAVSFGLTNMTKRYKDADKMVERLKKDYPDKKIILNSHSLGAAIGQELSYRHGLEHHGFSAGASPLTFGPVKHRVLHPKYQEMKKKNNIYLTKPSGLNFDPLSISNVLNPMATLHWVDAKKLKKEDQGILHHHAVRHQYPVALTE